jgi:glycylpeptide N-tetradecanoyltransferase
LKWALTPPTYEPELAFCIRVAKSGKMMAFISGIFIDLEVEENKVKATEVNFLCVHKMLRKHRIAQVLIQEVTRRSNVKGVWQGVIFIFLNFYQLIIQIFYIFILTNLM